MKCHINWVNIWFETNQKIIIKKLIQIKEVFSNRIPAEITVAEETTGVTCGAVATTVDDPNGCADCWDCCKACNANAGPLSWWAPLLVTICPITPDECIDNKMETSIIQIYK